MASLSIIPPMNDTPHTSTLYIPYSFLLILPLLLLGLLLAACGAAPPATIPPTPRTTTIVRLSTATPAPPTTAPEVAPTVAATANATQTLAAPIVLGDGPRRYGYRIVNQYPHDPQAWTQGLQWHEGVLYEGTGQYGRSSLRRVALETGEVLQQVNLPEQLYGEGITLLDGKIYQITWQNGIGLIYDASSFERIGDWRYDTEGWGLTHDGSSLIMSDGTSTLYFRDPATMAVTRELSVLDGTQPVTMLNELEYINSEILANVWQSDRIARIDPATGTVTGWIDLTGLLDRSTLTEPADVLNGIAYDATNNRLFVTGKLWPTLFEIELIPQE